jgi:hypothetical protein
MVSLQPSSTGFLHETHTNNKMNRYGNMIFIYPFNLIARINLQLIFAPPEIMPTNVVNISGKKNILPNYFIK